MCLFKTEAEADSTRADEEPVTDHRGRGWSIVATCQGMLVAKQSGGGKEDITSLAEKISLHTVVDSSMPGTLRIFLHPFIPRFIHRH